MVCMIFCPCSRKNGVILVGITDLIVGAAGLSAVSFLLVMISNEINIIQEDAHQPHERLHILIGLYWSVMLSYVFPTAITLLTGIFAIFSASQNNDCCAIIAIILTIIMVFSCSGILLILYLFGIEFPFLIPLIIGTVLHMYFTFVLLSYRTNDLKERRSV